MKKKKSLLLVLFVLAFLIGRGDIYSLISGDNDYDGLVDSEEDQLIQMYAPQIRLHSEDWCMPSSVFWYLPRTHMRYTHKGCSDCSIISHGSVTNTNITEQQHRNKNGWPWCDHTGSYKYSDSYSPSDHKVGFFLQQYDSTHSGCSNIYEWEVYAHVYRADGGGVVIQYWFFYPYNDGLSIQNHEGDWEHIVIILDGNRWLVKLAYYQHNTFTEYSPGQVQWVSGTHPVVYSAKGSHASYPECDYGYCTGGPFYFDNCNDTGIWWNSWEVGSLTNVGEKNYPLNNSNWIRYSGRWGEIGEFDGTSGPKSPAYQTDSWNKWGY